MQTQCKYRRETQDLQWKRSRSSVSVHWKKKNLRTSPSRGLEHTLDHPSFPWLSTRKGKGAPAVPLRPSSGPRGRVPSLWTGMGVGLAGTPEPKSVTGPKPRNSSQRAKRQVYKDGGGTGPEKPQRVQSVGRDSRTALGTHRAVSTARKATARAPGPGAFASPELTSRSARPGGEGVVPGKPSRPLPSTPPIGPPRPARLLTGFASHITVAKSSGESLAEGAGHRVGVLGFSRGPRERKNGETTSTQASPS